MDRPEDEGFFTRREMYEEFHEELGDVRSDMRDLSSEIDRAIVKMREYNDLRDNVNGVIETTADNQQAIHELQAKGSAWEYLQDNIAWWISGILSVVVLFYYFGVI